MASGFANLLLNMFINLRSELSENFLLAFSNIMFMKMGCDVETFLENKLPKFINANGVVLKLKKIFQSEWRIHLEKSSLMEFL